MRHFAPLLLIFATTSCDDRSKPNAADVRRSSAYWFPEIREAPSFIPTLPDDFISGFVTNKFIGDGAPTIVWGRSEDIEKLNRGAIVTPSIFVVGAQHKDPSLEGFRNITPSDKKEFIDNCAAMGYSDIHCGSRKLDGWTVDWFSGLRPPDVENVVWLSKPGRSSNVQINLIMGERGSNLWMNFIKPIEESEKAAASDHH